MDLGAHSTVDSPNLLCFEAVSKVFSKIKAQVLADCSLSS